ncbi:hypothetical protein ACP275_03G035200 [Erythranthe tilingii]
MYPMHLYVSISRLLLYSWLPPSFFSPPPTLSILSIAAVTPLSTLSPPLAVQTLRGGNKIHVLLQPVIYLISRHIQDADRVIRDFYKAYMVPRMVMFKDEFPKAFTSKFQKQFDLEASPKVERICGINGVLNLT